MNIEIPDAPPPGPPPRSSYFVCPFCQGTFFGRDTGVVDGRIATLDTVRCHDERKRGCKWRGVWPR